MAVVTVLLEEGMAALAACGPLAAIPLLAAPLLWLVHVMFKHAAPR